MGSDGHRLLRMALLEARLSKRARPPLLGSRAEDLRSRDRNECESEHLAPNLQLPLRKYLQTCCSGDASRLWEKRQFLPAVQAPLLKNLQGMCWRLAAVIFRWKISKIGQLG